MSDEIKTEYKQDSFSKESFQQSINWFFCAALAFMIVIMLHQFFVGSISYILGYVTKVHFGKIESLPHYDVYWNSTRVVAMYAIPTFLLLLLAGVCIASCLFGSQGVNIWMWLRFWIMVFSLLLGTTLMTLALCSTLSVSGSLYQGFGVIVHWFDLHIFWSILLITLAIALNFGFGLASSAIIMYLAPSDFMIKKGKKHPQKIVLNSFIYTMIFVFLIALAFSVPSYWQFFFVMFFLSLFWLPGLFIISNDTLRKRASRGEVFESRVNYFLVITTLVLIGIIFLFFR
jgi:hypothetical protein